MTDIARDRSRLIDHFKRLYTIVVGLAITDGVRKLLPFSPDTFSWSSLWMLLAFLVTVVPIFQGGDRSLDLTYLDDRADKKPHNRLHYIWDVYMLLITAISFAAIAEAIPPVGKDHSSVSPILFYYAMMGMLILDVIILIVDFLKTDISDKIAAYIPWIVMNGMLAIAFAIALFFLRSPKNSVATISFIIFMCAVIRTKADYYFGRNFLFPKTGAIPDPTPTTTTL